MRTEETVVMSLCEDCAILDVHRTMTVYTGAIYDPDDGLPLSYEGERNWGEGRLFAPSAFAAANRFQGG